MKSQPLNSTKKRPPFGESRYWGLFFISPWLIGLLFLKLAPILTSLGLSFTDFYLLEPAQTRFVGFENYIATFADANAGTAFLQTCYLALILIPSQTLAAIFLAAVLNNPNLRWRGTLRSLFFIPSVLPALSAAFMWQGFLNPYSGWLNRLFLNPLGLGRLNTLYSRASSVQLLTLTSLWAIGPGFLIILSAMQAIPPEIHEAARIDGANKLREFISITLPLVSPSIFFTLILNMTSVMGGAVLLDRGHNFNQATSSYDGYVNHVLFDMFRLGQASSAAWVFFAFAMTVILVFFFTARYWVYFPDRETSR